MKVFAFVMPLSGFLNTRLLFIILVLSFFVSGSFKKTLEQSKDILIYIIVIISGLIYTSDISSGLKVIETNFSFVAMPLIFSCIQIWNERKLHEIFYSFILGLITACLICFGNSAHTYFNSGDTNVFFFYELTDIIKLQPTYLAYYLIFAITFVLFFIYYRKSQIHPLLLGATVLFLFLMLILTGSQTTFVSMLLIFSFFILKFLVDPKSFYTKLAFSLAVTMLACMFIVKATEQANRDIILNDSWERFVLWESAIKATPDPILGVGTGGDKKILNEYYLSHDLPKFADDSYNSHNQFVQILLTNGILGVISVLILICRPLYLSVKYQDVLGTLVFFPFLIYGMTEVFLGRYQGLVFFTFLHQVFILQYTSLKHPLTSLKGV